MSGEMAKSILDLGVALPGSAEAVARGCICPSASPWPLVALFYHDGHWFLPNCPAHAIAVRAEVQRLFGSAQ